MRRVLTAILFLFEPYLAAGLLLRVGPTLLHRDAWTWIAFAVRIALALISVAAAIGLQEARPFGRPLALTALTCSGLFAVAQYFTRVLPTSVPPDAAFLFTAIIVMHHAAWVVYLLRLQTPDPRLQA